MYQSQAYEACDFLLRAKSQRSSLPDVALDQSEKLIRGRAFVRGQGVPPEIDNTVAKTVLG